MKKHAKQKAGVYDKEDELADRNDEATVASWENILRCCYSDIKKKTIRETPDTQGRACGHWD